MGSHSYLLNLDTNIHDLQTSGLLNSHASRYTTTNVGHMHGDRTSVISLGELYDDVEGKQNTLHKLLDFKKAFDSVKVYTPAQAYSIEHDLDRALDNFEQVDEKLH